MRADWKSVFYPLLVLVIPSSVYAGVFSAGFNLILQSRFGLTAGYYFTDNIGIEAHFGGIKKKMVRYGISFIARPVSDNNNFYFLLGYAAGPRWGLFTPQDLDSYKMYPLHSTETFDRGFNIACGYDVKFRNTKWRIPMELGVYLITHSELIQYELIQYLGKPREYVYVGRERERRKPFLIPLLGYGLRWFSKSED